MAYVRTLAINVVADRPRMAEKPVRGHVRVHSAAPKGQEVFSHTYFSFGAKRRPGDRGRTITGPRVATPESSHSIVLA